MKLVSLYIAIAGSHKALEIFGKGLHTHTHTLPGKKNSHQEIRLQAKYVKFD